MIDSGADRRTDGDTDGGARRASSARWLSGALAALWLGIVIPPAGAQQAPIGAPLRLGPPGSTALPAPDRVVPPPSGIAIDGSPKPGADSVEIAPLGTIDPDMLGTSGPAGDPFTQELWRRTPRDVATVLLQRLPGAVGSAALRDLQRRLLTAQAKPPEGNPPPGAPPLIALRAAKLVEMGDADGADALLRLVSAKLDEEPVLRVRVEQAILADKRDEACAEVTRQVARFPNVFWQQVQVACQAAAGQDGPAGLGAQLLREQGFDNVGFFNLVELANGGRNLPIDKLGAVTPAALILLRAAKHDVPADSLAASAPGVLRAIALAPELPLPTRLAAGERAAGFGALAPAALGQLYLSLEAPPADIANAAALAKSDKTARARALLFHAARDQGNPVTRADLVRAAFESARAAGLYAPTAALYRPMIEEIPPTAELLAFAGEATRALLMDGATDGARRWYDLVRARAATDTEAARLEAQLWTLFRLAGLDDTAFEPVRLLAWYDAQSARPAAALADRAALVFGLLGALGDKVPSGAWLPLLVNAADAPRPVPGTGPLLELGAAAADTRIGEAVALAVTTIGRDPAAAGALACTGVTAALRSLNLAPAARRFAVEIAITAGS